MVSLPRDQSSTSDFDSKAAHVSLTNIRKKKALFMLLAILLGLTVSLAVCELVLRFLGIQPERHAPPRWLVMQDGHYRSVANMWGDGMIKTTSRFANQGVVMGEYVPNAQFKVIYSSNPRGYFDPDNGVTFKINSSGLRGPEVTEKKPPGSLRILGLGDSFTFGEGVRDEDTFLRRLEQSLNQNSQGSRSFEVLNAGTQGYNSRDEILYLERRWLQLSPDIILISFYLNDAYADGSFWIRGEGLGIYLAEPQGFAQYSKLLDLVQHEYAARKIRQSMQQYYSQAYFSQPERSFNSISSNNVDWHVSRSALERATQLSKNQGIKVALVIFPEFQNLDKEYPFESVHKLVRTSCESFGMPVLDLLDTYRGHRDRDLWVHPSDHHPNEVAHKMAASAIESFLYQNILDNE